MGAVAGVRRCSAEDAPSLDAIVTAYVTETPHESRERVATAWGYRRRQDMDEALRESKGVRLFFAGLRRLPDVLRERIARVILGDEYVIARAPRRSTADLAELHRTASRTVQLYLDCGAGDAVSRVAIVGSRGWLRPGLVDDAVHGLPIGTVVISGGAAGVDSWAVEAAEGRELEWVEHLPDYATHGNRAPLVRNEKIAADCDYMIAFWDGKSRGTLHAIGCARKLGKRVVVYGPDGNEVVP